MRMGRSIMSALSTVLLTVCDSGSAPEQPRMRGAFDLVSCRSAGAVGQDILHAPPCHTAGTNQIDTASITFLDATSARWEQASSTLDVSSTRTFVLLSALATYSRQGDTVIVQPEGNTVMAFRWDGEGELKLSLEGTTKDLYLRAPRSIPSGVYSVSKCGHHARDSYIMFDSLPCVFGKPAPSSVYYDRLDSGRVELSLDGVARWKMFWTSVS